ncbi:DUF596 domain-containing protein [Chromobacterium vaccinii]|uniref:DUF596 domain-containing protein n=1 Tax=Chromobacterium vaccinii TaxID=1108595 RepID=UPI001C9309C3|nr:DUF596 domain-containing protein [Chromobacterium vaccinii]
MKSGELKLAKNGVELPLSVEEQVALFDTSWPEGDILNSECPEMDFIGGFLTTHVQEGLFG